jgi:hypothetical protein
MEETQIIIEEKKPYSGNADRHPTGDFYCDNVKYTYWDDDFDNYQVGDLIRFTYTSNENVHKGKTYVNRNISKIIPVETEDKTAIIQAPSQPQQVTDTTYGGYPNSELQAGSVVIEGKTYEVILRLKS